jgi:hypothetical protein
MKQVTLYSGCSFNYSTRQGNYFAALEYNGKLKRIFGTIEGEHETGNRVIIYGLIEAVKLLKEPCELTILTCTPVGFKKNFKSRNGDLILQLLDVISEKGCVFKYGELPKEEIDRKIRTYAVRQ